MTLASGLAVAFGTETIGSGLAAIALALSAYWAFTAGDSRVPTNASLVGACALSGALFHLGERSGARTTTVVALVAALALLAGAVTTMRLKQRSWLFLVGVAAVALPAGAALWNHERALVETANLAVENGIQAARRGDAATARTELRAASEAFTVLQSDFNAWWTTPARLIPGVAQHLVAARALAAAGADLSTTAITIASKVDPSTVRITDGRVDLAALSQLDAPLAEAIESLGRARKATLAERSIWLLPPVGNAIDDFQERTGRTLIDAQRARDAVRVAPELLGGNGPRRYFLALETNAEMRGTGGLVGNYGVVTADDGQIELSRFGRIEELNPPEGGQRRLRVTGPADYLARYRDSFTLDQHWQNVTASPDFPSVGQVIAGLAPQSGLGEVDGAIAIDPFGLAALLRVTGPVSVPDWPEPITADNAAEILLYRQYVEFGDRANTERVEFLASTSAAVFERLTSGSLSSVAAMVDALGPAVGQKRLQLFSTNTDAQAVLVRAGVAGAVQPVVSDYLGVVTQDATPSKLDWFLRRSIDYEASVDPSTRRVEAVATITLRNNAPSTGLPRLAYGSSHYGLGLAESRTYFSIYSPLILDSGTVEGQIITMESATELGRFVYSGFVTIPPGQQRTVVVKLSGFLPPTGDYELIVGRQPAVAPDDLSLTIRHAGSSKTLLSHREELSTDKNWAVQIRP